MIEKADSNNDGLVTKEDFYNMMTKKTFDWNVYDYIELFIYNIIQEIKYFLFIIIKNLNKKLYKNIFHSIFLSILKLKFYNLKSKNIECVLTKRWFQIDFYNSR